MNEKQLTHYTQADIFNAETAKEAAIKQAVDHADNYPPFNWSEKALTFVTDYVKNLAPGVPFFAEEIILNAVVSKAIPPPPDDRAYGAIMKKAQKAGLIKSIGVGKQKNPKCHRNYKTIWVKQ